MKYHIFVIGSLAFLLQNSLYGMAALLSYDQRRNRTAAELVEQYGLTINNILQRSILPDGKIDKAQLNHLLDLIETIRKDSNLKLYIRTQLINRIHAIYDQVPRASRILMSGYNKPYFEKVARYLKNRQSFYAQPLIDLQRRDWDAAHGIAIGFPKNYKIATPSPFDVDYEQLVNDYIDYADHLENMGFQPILSELKQLAADFTTKFDRMLMVNDIGKAKKKQLIEWIGGPQNYLGVILGQKIKEAEIVKNTIDKAHAEQARFS